MHDIAKTDPNFKVDRNLDLPDAVFYAAQNPPFALHGVMHDKKGFYRLPEEVAASVNEGTHTLCRITSGGRLRFVTDSPYVALRIATPKRAIPSHICALGYLGFDLYRDGVFAGAFLPPPTGETRYESIVRFADETEKEITLHFPLYGGVDALSIGLKEGSVLKAPSPLPCNKKIVFYGSSITQGACVSRSGLSYVNIVARELGCEVVNLGFSGNAKGEIAMAEYIASLSPDLFVMDYDHNAPTRAHLEETHGAFFRAFRARCPFVPVVMLSAPDLRFKVSRWAPRREVVRRTWEEAKKSGDENVYFIDGETLFLSDAWDSCSTDGIHPNDLGHFFFAQRILPLLKELTR